MGYTRFGTLRVNLEYNPPTWVIQHVVIVFSLVLVSQYLIRCGYRLELLFGISSLQRRNIKSVQHMNQSKTERKKNIN